MSHNKPIIKSFIIVVVVLLVVFTTVYMSTRDFAAHETRLNKQLDRLNAIEDKLRVQPADVLEELKAARGEFRSSRFTHADGERMNERITRLEATAKQVDTRTTSD